MELLQSIFTTEVLFPFRSLVKKLWCAGHWWLTSIILAIQEAEIRRMEV
jgi:hypothetical protein